MVSKGHPERESRSESQERLDALRKLLSSGLLSSQEELRLELINRKFDVTQSTISRDLRRLGAVRGVDGSGRAVYRMPEESNIPIRASSLRDLVLSMKSNGTLIVIKTSPGSASLVARHLDQTNPGKAILGTIAGDDTIFVALAKPQKGSEAIESIELSL